MPFHYAESHSMIRLIAGINEDLIRLRVNN